MRSTRRQPSRRASRPFPVVDVAPRFDPAEAWARSGAMALTGATDGPPLPCPSPLLAARLVAAGSVIQLLAATTFGSALALDPLALLGERAALTGHTRRGSISVGGACEMLPAADGWIALNLARPDDVALLPAWLDGEIEHASDADGTRRAIGRRSSSELVARGAVLGLAVGAWPADREDVREPVRRRRRASEGDAVATGEHRTVAPNRRRRGRGS